VDKIDIVTTAAKIDIERMTANGANSVRDVL
jgi:hypothetical protein